MGLKKHVIWALEKTGRENTPKSSILKRIQAQKTRDLGTREVGRRKGPKIGGNRADEAPIPFVFGLKTRVWAPEKLDAENTPKSSILKRIQAQKARVLVARFWGSRANEAPKPFVLIQKHVF